MPRRRAPCRHRSSPTTPAEPWTTVSAPSSRSPRDLFPDVRRGLLVEWGAWGDRDTAELDPHADGPGPDRLLRDPAVALARRVLPPHHHRVPRRVGPRRSVCARARSRWWATRRRRARTRCAGCLRDNGIPHSFVASRRPGGRVSCCRGRASTRTRPPWCCCTTGACSSTPTNAELAVGLRPAGRRARRRRCSTSSSSVPGRRARGRRVRGPRRACGRWSSSARSIGGQAGSSSLIRNYLGLRPGDLRSRAGPARLPAGLGVRLLLRALAGRGVARRRRATDASWSASSRTARCGPARSSSPQGSPTDASACPTSMPLRVGRRVLRRLRLRRARACAAGGRHVVGGGNSAGQAALHLARYAHEVTLLVRGATLAESMSQYLIDTLAARRRRGPPRTPRSSAGAARPPRPRRRARPRHRRADATEPTRRACSCSSAPNPAPTGCPTTVLRDRWGYVLTGDDVPRRGRSPRLAARRTRRSRWRRRARGVRRGRRPARVGQARRVRRRRGLGRRVVGARAPRPPDGAPLTTGTAGPLSRAGSCPPGRPRRRSRRR